MNIADTMAPTISAQQDYSRIKSEAADNVPFQAISQPTAEGVNAAAAQQQPTSIASFYARGGLSGTAKQMVNEIQVKRQKKAERAAYERLLEAGEQGADALYEDAINTYGEESKNFIPPKTFFYDDDGVFLPHKYSQSVYLGVQKFKEQKKKLDDEALKKQQFQQAGQVIADATDRQSATAGILSAGIDANEYDKSIGQLPSAKDKIDAQYLPQKYEAEISELNAKASKARREGGSGGSSSTVLPGLYSNKAKLLEQLAKADKVASDPVSVSDPVNGPKIIANAEKQKTMVQKAIDALDRNIASEEAKRYPGAAPVPQEPTGPSDEAVRVAGAITNGLTSMPPKGMFPRTDEVGSPSYSKGKKGPPNNALYNTEVARRTKMYLDQKGISSFPEALIAEGLKEMPLENMIDIILRKSAQAGRGAPKQPAAPAPPTGTTAGEKNPTKG